MLICRLVRSQVRPRRGPYPSRKWRKGASCLAYLGRRAQPFALTATCGESAGPSDSLRGARALEDVAVRPREFHGDQLLGQAPHVTTLFAFSGRRLSGGAPRRSLDAIEQATAPLNSEGLTIPLAHPDATSGVTGRGDGRRRTAREVKMAGCCGRVEAAELGCGRRPSRGSAEGDVVDLD